MGRWGSNYTVHGVTCPRGGNQTWLPDKEVEEGGNQTLIPDQEAEWGREYNQTLLPSPEPGEEGLEGGERRGQAPNMLRLLTPSQIKGGVGRGGGQQARLPFFKLPRRRSVVMMTYPPYMGGEERG